MGEERSGFVPLGGRVVELPYRRAVLKYVVVEGEGLRVVRSFWGVCDGFPDKKYGFWRARRLRLGGGQCGPEGSGCVVLVVFVS